MTESEADEALALLTREIQSHIDRLAIEIGLEARVLAAQHPGLHREDVRGRPLLMPRVALLAQLSEHRSARTAPSRVIAGDREMRYLAIEAVTPNAAPIPTHRDS